MHADLVATLAKLRARRGFHAASTVLAKAALLERYTRAAGIKAVVVGVSGGVDSAVTLALCARAARIPGSTIERVVAALLPVDVDGATHQAEALAHGREVAERFGAAVLEASLAAGHAAVRASVERGLGVVADAWAAGQLVSTMRTPALYFATSLLTSQGQPAVVVGTTNRDEGAWLGFFGKASDGMVDIQLVGDLHKSEIYALAKLLDVPRSVIEAVPSGDTYDGKSDHDMIGASYEAVELSLALRCDPHVERAWCGDAEREWSAVTELLEERHRVNAHKYIGDSPAVFLDVWPRAVPGGWREAPRRAAVDVDNTKFVGLFDLDVELDERAELHGRAGVVAREGLADFGESAFIVRNVLNARECRALVDAVARVPRVPVGVDGKAAPLTRCAGARVPRVPVGVDGKAAPLTRCAGASAGAGAGAGEGAGAGPGAAVVGSTRASAWSPALAEQLWHRVSPALTRLRVMDELTPTDHGGHPVWRAVGVSPLLRFIWSEPGGVLIPHVDSGFDFGDGRMTLMSVVIALTDEGATHLLLDRQRNCPVRERDFADAACPAGDDDVLARVTHRAGSALVLDHRVWHEGARVENGVKLLLRTDIVFERCDVGRVCTGVAVPHDVFPGAGAAVAGEAADKIARDPFYAGALSVLSDVDAVVDAGFFDDGAPLEHDVQAERDPRWLVTPVHKIAQPAGDRPLAVVVTTGALCPVHRGHVELLERARDALSENGYDVVGGYLAPDHDRYVSMKLGPDAVPAAHRVRLCEEAVRKSDWLMVDPWAALHVDRAVNFTDIVLRLERVLAAHVRSARPIHVAYAFGSDNARFSSTFLTRGLGVCVPRPGAPASKCRGRVVVARDFTREAASSTVRAGDDSALDDDVRALWRSWRSAKADTAALVYLRDEGDWAVRTWGAAAAYARFRDGVVDVVKAAFRDAAPPDVRREVRVEILELEAQRRRLRELLAGERALSLDPCVEGDANLAVSRCFDVAASAPRGLCARPGSPSLAEQVQALPRGSFALVDDDVVTGATLAAVRALLPKDVTITREIALCDTRGRGVVDLVDCRDFLAGARDAGLVLALPNGELARAPYALPYARPSDRMSAPPSTEKALSRAIWQLNARFFDEVHVVVREASPAFRALCSYVGFDDATDMRAVCAWHLARL